MKFNPEKHRRRSIRLCGYDYAQSGAYFVTVCAHERTCLFGDVVNGEMRYNPAGLIAQSVWEELPLHYKHVELDAFVVMPNHVHGIIVITDKAVGAGLKPARTTDQTYVGAGLKPARITDPYVGAGLKPAPTRHGLAEIIRAFKTFSARRINQMRRTAGAPVWQRNYYEHVIRNETALQRIRQYVQTNPTSWVLDRENPDQQGEDPFDGWLASYTMTPRYHNRPPVGAGLKPARTTDPYVGAGLKPARTTDPYVGAGLKPAPTRGERRSR